MQDWQGLGQPASEHAPLYMQQHAAPPDASARITAVTVSIRHSFHVEDYLGVVQAVVPGVLVVWDWIDVPGLYGAHCGGCNARRSGHAI